MIEQAALIGLAGWRVAHLLVEEDGPFDIFLNLRERFLKPGLVKGFWPKLFSCVWCMSVWTTIISYCLYRLEPIIVMIVAAMGIAVLLQRHSEDN